MSENTGTVPTSIFQNIAESIAAKPEAAATDNTSNEENQSTEAPKTEEKKVETAEKTEAEKALTEKEGEDNETWTPEFEADGSSKEPSTKKPVEKPAPVVVQKPAAPKVKTQADIRAEIMNRAEQKGLDPIKALQDAQPKDISKLSRDEKLAQYFDAEDLADAKEALETMDVFQKKEHFDKITKELQDREDARVKGFTESLGLGKEKDAASEQVEVPDPVELQNLIHESVSELIDSKVGKEIYGFEVTPAIANEMKEQHKTGNDYMKSDGTVDTEAFLRDSFETILWKKYGVQIIQENCNRAYKAGILAERNRKSNPDKNINGGTVPLNNNTKTEVQSAIDRIIGRT